MLTAIGINHKIDFVEVLFVNYRILKYIRKLNFLFSLIWNKNQHKRMIFASMYMQSRFVDYDYQMRLQFIY